MRKLNTQFYTVEDIENILDGLGITLSAKRAEEGWQPQVALLSKFGRLSELDDDALDEVQFSFFEDTGHFLNRELLRVVIKGICIRNAIIEEEDEHAAAEGRAA